MDRMADEVFAKCCMDENKVLTHESMKIITLLTLLLCSQIALADGDSYTESLDAWHEARIKKLTKPDGYLSLVGLHWVKDKAREFEGIGRAWLADGKVHLELIPGFELDGEAVHAVTLDPTKPEGSVILRKGSLSFYTVVRGPRVGLRVKDFQAPTRVEFQGVQRFAPDPKWRIEGKLQVDHRDVPIGSVIGVTSPETSPGLAVFEMEGQTFKARLIGEPEDKKFFLVFSDQTAGKSTYSACRFLSVERRGRDGLILDFNKSINPACAFTHFATCPLPPEENLFSVAIPAGEKTPK